LVRKALKPEARSLESGVAAPQNTKQKFSKSRRLLRHVDFDRVYKKGRRHFATHMTVFYLRRETDEQQAGPSQLRIGFTVRKVLGGAVERNRMKRRLREAVRLQPMLPESAVDIVINPKASLLTADFAELHAEVANAFQVIQKSLLQESGRKPTQ
jgi:ribonuclease P protein component